LRWLAGDTPNIEEGARGCHENRKRRKARGGNHQPGPPALQERYFATEFVDVNEIIREMVVLLRGETIRYNISVGTDLAADLPQVMADRVQLQQVLMNLMINGIEAIKDAGGTHELAIRSQRTEIEEVVVSVTDSGVGLPSQQTEQIFNAFFTTKPHGTGMGLRISHSIIESHGGRLWAANNSPRVQVFVSVYPPRPRRLNDGCRCSHSVRR